MTPQEQADAVLAGARQLSIGLKAGAESVADARALAHTIREAEGWLLSARRFLDPEDWMT